MPRSPEALTAPLALPESWADRLILAYVAGILVLWSPGLNLGLLTPRLALFLIGLGPGLVVLGSLVRRRDVGASWLGAFVVWALVATVLSPSPRLALLGTYGSDVGWIYLAGYASAWALGRRLGADGTRLLPAVLLGGLGVNVLFAILQAVFEPTGALEMVDGRVFGLMSNTLFLAGSLAGALALIGYLAGASARRGLAITGLAVPFTAAINLTGSRAALAGGVVLALVAAVVGRRTRPAEVSDLVRTVLLVAAAVAVGFCASIPLQNDASGASRIGDVSSSSGYGSRLTMWEAGLAATGERPIAGWGPGRFREATSTRVTQEFAAAETPDRLFYDAHNVAVEQLVTTGVIGLVLFGGFVVAVFRRARGPLVWFAGGVALTWLLNPTSVCTAPVVLLALGAAWTQQPARTAAPSARRVAAARGVGAGLALAGAVVGGTLIWTDVLIERGSVDADVAVLEDAARLRPGDPVLQGLVADALFKRALDSRTDAARRAAVAAADETVRLEPSRSTWWLRRGTARGAFGPGTQDERVQAAKADYERALELNPWSLSALVALRDVAMYEEDRAAFDRWSERICRISDCSPP